MMKMFVGAVVLTAMIGTVPAYAQTRLDHDVQRLWDDTVRPDQRGSDRTDWERRRDADRYNYEREQQQREAYERDRQRGGYDRDRQREAERAEWCRYHPGACGGPGYGNSYSR